MGTGTPLVTSFGWDSRHQLATVTDPIGRVLRTTYDLAGRPTSTVEDEGGLALTTLYAHDKDDLLTGLTDPDGKVTGWIHDLLGRVREIDYALGGSELFTHDGEDAVVTHTRQDGVVTTLTYRADGALSSRTVGAQREEFDWAAVGVPREARVLVSGLVKSRVSRAFDGLGRLASESQDDFTVALTYDPSHNPVTVTWPDGTTLTQDFDELERLEGLREGATDVAAWTWSGPGRVASRSTGQSLGLVTTYQWDPFQRLAGLDTGAVHDVAYGYDALDRRCWKQSQHLLGQPIDVYGYDGGSRLVDVWEDANAALCAQAPTGWSSYLDLTLSPGEDRTQTSLDSGGGPVTTSYNSGAIDALHRYTNVGGTARLHDAKGNLTSDGTLSYEYDAWNRLTAVKAGGSERARYEHDALGRRTRKIEPTLETSYVYSGARLIAEYEDSGAGPVLARRYLHGVGLDDLVALDSGGQRYFAFGDALGSVETLATAGGTKVELYRYDAFGSATVMNGSEVEFPLNSYNLPQSPLKNALWFTGARFDGESGQYHMRARQYEPKTGRFTGRDPLGYFDSANAYLYGFNDPANWSDPFGLAAHSGPWGGQHRRREINVVAPTWLPGAGWVNSPVDIYSPSPVPTAPRPLNPPPVPVPAGQGIGRRAYGIAKAVFLGIVEAPIATVRAGHDIVNEGIAWSAYAMGGTYSYSPWTSGGKLTQELMSTGMSPGEAAVYGTFESARGAAVATRNLAIDVLGGELLGMAGRTARRWMRGADEAAAGLDDIGVSGCASPSPGDLGDDFARALDDIQAGRSRPNVRDPKPFANDGRGGTSRLPETNASGNPVEYVEHTVNPRPPGGTLDGRRIVTGSDGSVWATTDHFQTWVQIQ